MKNKNNKPRLLFGTNNQHKLQEIREIMGDIYDVVSLKDLGIDLDVEETELTLEGNALLKARVYFAETGIPCFADDSGLEVDALEGQPGVFSARFAGEGCSYADNVQKLLQKMDGKTDRKAQFRAVIAYTDGNRALTFDGVVKGFIIHEPKGAGGFGYDPVFQPDEYALTFAEMKPEDKHRISHRGKAVRKFSDFMRNESA